MAALPKEFSLLKKPGKSNQALAKLRLPFKKWLFLYKTRANATETALAIIGYLATFALQKLHKWSQTWDKKKPQTNNPGPLQYHPPSGKLSMANTPRLPWDLTQDLS